MSSSDNINSNTMTSTTNSDTETNNDYKIIGFKSLITIVSAVLIALIALIVVIAGCFISKKNKKEDNKTTFDKDKKDIKTDMADNNLDETKKTNEVKL